jgi:hypothetical protein
MQLHIYFPHCFGLIAFALFRVNQIYWAFCESLNLSKPYN